MNCYDSYDFQTCLNLFNMIRIDNILEYVKTWRNTLKFEQTAQRKLTTTTKWFLGSLSSKSSDQKEIHNNFWTKLSSSDHSASVVNAACMWLAAACAFSYSIVLAACMYVCSTFCRAEAPLMLRSLQKNIGQRCTHDLLWGNSNFKSYLMIIWSLSLHRLMHPG